MDTEKEVKLVNVDDIIPNRFQPRLAFNEDELKQLAASIKQHGVIQPLVLRRLGEKYEIIAGERRYKASCLAGLKEVPAIIMNVDDNKSAEIAVVENIQRKDLTAIEEAQSYKKLLDNGMKQDELATKMGVSQPTIANKVRLLALDDSVQKALLENKISERHARSLLQIQDKEKQKELLGKILNQRLTVKQTDEEIRNMLGKVEPQAAVAKEDIFDLNVENVKNETKDLFEKSEIKSFDDLMKAQGPIESPQPLPVEQTPVVEERTKIEPPRPIQTDDVPEILSFDDEIEEPAIPEINEKPNPIIEEYRKIEETQTPTIVEPTPTNSISSAIEDARNFSKNLSSKGFKVNTEEFDFEDMYQIVIKIQKN